MAVEKVKALPLHIYVGAGRKLKKTHIQKNDGERGTGKSPAFFLLGGIYAFIGLHRCTEQDDR